ncbi:MAG: amino acid ABC transporter permease [Methanomassiliicoccales archaeon]|jgi:ectoine/hydroxyectoine ABC transporter permease protein EhuC|nr:amino acid ABC transporter permease [Methanomassiliicoccales archaeon]
MGLEIIANNLGFFLKGAILTLEISLAAIALGFALGVPMGLARISRVLPVRALATGYVEALRGTPLLVQIFIVYFGLPSIGIYLDPLVSGILAVGLNSAAYQAEILRGGIQSVPKGQMEAARSMGMTYGQSMRRVVLPQAMRLIIPPMTNEFIILIKDSSLVSAISVWELTLVAKELNAKYFDPFTIFLFVAAVYFIMTFATSKILRVVEKKTAIPGFGAGD